MLAEAGRSRLLLVIVLTVWTSGCKSPPRPGSGGDVTDEEIADEPAEVADDSKICLSLLRQMRKLRDGPQPCDGNGDCTVWHNGEYWDGCPVEVNKGNASTLDALRKEIEDAGCDVETDKMCPTRITRKCMEGQCGKEPRFIMHPRDRPVTLPVEMTERGPGD